MANVWHWFKGLRKYRGNEFAPAALGSGSQRFEPEDSSDDDMPSSSLLEWSPHPEDQAFAYAQNNTVRLCQWQPPTRDGPPRRPTQTLVATYHDTSKVECLAWSPDPQVSDLVAIGVTGGNVSLVRLSQYTQQQRSARSTMHTPVLSSSLESNTDIKAYARDLPDDAAPQSTPSATRGPVGPDLTVTHGRSCQALAFCPQNHHLLAVGLSRHRNEHGLLVWDTEKLLAPMGDITPLSATAGERVDVRSPSPYGGGSDSHLHGLHRSPQRVESSAHISPLVGTAPPIGHDLALRPATKHVVFTSSNLRLAAPTRPEKTYAFKESVPSMAWLNSAPYTLMVGGMASYHNMVYVCDIRQDRPAATIRTAGVCGMTCDPLDPYRLASFATAGVVHIWDSRYPVREVLTIPSGSKDRSPIQQIAFSPHRRGILACLYKDQDHIRLYGIETCATESRLPLGLGSDVSLSDSLLTAETMSRRFTLSSASSFPDLPEATDLRETFLWRTRRIQTDPSTVLRTFAWIPPQVSQAMRYRILTVNDSGNLESRKVEEIPRTAWEPRGSLAVAGENFSKIYDLTAPLRPAKTSGTTTAVSGAAQPTTHELTQSLGGLHLGTKPAASTSHPTRPSAPTVTIPGAMTSAPTGLYQRRLASQAGPSGAVMATDPTALVSPWNQTLTVCDRYLVSRLQRDISAVMRQRAEQGYAMDPSKNLEIIGHERPLREAWSWIKDAVTLAEENGFVGGSIKMSFMGIQKVLRELSKRDSATFKNRQAEYQSNSANDQIYQGSQLNVQRKLALRISGCHYSQHRLEKMLCAMEAEGQYEKAAGWALFHDCHERCIQALRNSGKDHLEMMAMALAAHAARVVDRSNHHYMEEWKAMNHKFMQATDNPYLRAIFKYYHDENWTAVLEERGLSMKERLAIALRFLDDHQLLSYVNGKTATTTQHGNLEGLILTGLTERTMQLLRNYVDQTADVQTASLILSFSPTPSTPHSIKGRCIEDYRDLLDQWQMYETRAMFDIDRGAWARKFDIRPPPLQEAPMVVVRCTYCNGNLMQSLNLVGGLGLPAAATSAGSVPAASVASSAIGLDRGDGSRRFPAMAMNRFDGVLNDTSMQCPACKAALPSCPICLLSLGTPPNICIDYSDAKGKDARRGTVDPFDWWFTWCQTCRHGGHQKHMAEWFLTHTVCPVADCLCHCRDLD
ncbi:hypothetical protein H4R34_002310 [Dimargaris verticillata]|uniref:Uncharacterized protein n=1 Tax=Dimargaris verticillata TaxID=2761393 RepID=A0A9W8ED08_9FUNG|nr:hypothetical protein H4R34_002310 [Dimargaris verticillata]